MRLVAPIVMCHVKTRLEDGKMDSYRQKTVIYPATSLISFHRLVLIVLVISKLQVSRLWY